MSALATLPDDTETLLRLTWAEYQPAVDELLAEEITPETVDAWLTGWSALEARLHETFSRLYVAITLDTGDEVATTAYHRFLEEVYPPGQQSAQQFREKFLASGLAPDGFEIPRRKMEAQVALFREENIPLQVEEHKLGEEYDKIVGAQLVEWEGEKRPIPQMTPIFQDPDRETRERAWRATRERQLADREALNDLWVRLLDVRRQLAANAGYDNYRDYRWQDLLRFDYTPEDCRRFDEAILQVVVPAATRILAHRKEQLGLERLRPWDLEVDPRGRPPLRPFADVDTLITRTDGIFHRVDPALGADFSVMRERALLDLASRANKAPGGYCTYFPLTALPYIFMNAAGIHDDVQTLLHEGGHAFHEFEISLPWLAQRDVGIEFAEVASMAMELLAAPYLADPQTGFYDRADAARARIEHLEGIILFWPYMAVVDRFQHWVYEHPDQAQDSSQADRVWTDLYTRYHPGEDWSGLEDILATGWHRKPHIFDVPFYYVEYGLAQLGSVQIFGNARRDQAEAVARYRHALSLGGTRSIPQLYAAAGARFAFDAGTLQDAVKLVEDVIAELRAHEDEATL